MAMAVQPVAHAAGSRKEARARVWLRPGSGRIVVNEGEVETYFSTAALQQAVRRPLAVAGAEGRFDVVAHVDGGGVRGQAGAVRHALARALLLVDEGVRGALGKEGLLPRDPRVKERKKDGGQRA